MIQRPQKPDLDVLWETVLDPAVAERLRKVFIVILADELAESGDGFDESPLARQD
jgi:hypothetical protein